MSEPTTTAGRALLDESFQADWMTRPVEECVAMVLAIEQKARRKALAEVRAAIEELDPEDSMRPNDPTDESWDGGFYSGRDHAVAAIDKLEASDEL